MFKTVWERIRKFIFKNFRIIIRGFVFFRQNILSFKYFYIHKNKILDTLETLQMIFISSNVA
jgi:hypothetical protein